MVEQRFVRSPDRVEEGEGAQALSKPVATMAQRLTDSGWFKFARRELGAGRNPAKKGWQQVLCSALITGGVSRKTLQLAFVQQLDMTPGSAKVQVSKSVAVFLQGRLLLELNGYLKLHRD
jgi:hypothetical protein